MRPGPDSIYECPNCSCLISRGSLASGNTIGVKHYSDGKRIAPMLPEFPSITKCVQCDTILWLLKLKPLGTYEYGDEDNESWKLAPKAAFLSIADYFRVLEKGLTESEGEELFVRHLIWWAYNDRTRNEQTIFTDAQDEARWRENILRLLEMLDPAVLEFKLKIADINRNLGNFEECQRIIKEIDHENVNWVKDYFLKACIVKNKLVLELW